MLFILRPSWIAQLRPSQLETFGLIYSMLGIYLKVVLKNFGSIVTLLF